MTSNRVFFISKYLFDNRYKINRLEEEKKLIIDAEIKICLEKEVCGSAFKVFDRQLIPQPLCDMEMDGFFFTQSVNDISIKKINHNITCIIIDKCL
jgi:hypothetical protein